MPLPLIMLAAAAASFSCENPRHHDGDNLRCANVPGSMRLQGIDAHEMPGACRPGRACVEGDPYAARDYLRSLTAGKVLQCVQADTDNYDRRIVNCNANGVNIGCAMIAAGQAVPRYAPLDCGDEAAPEQQRASPVQRSEAPVIAEAEPPPVIVPDDTPAHTPVRLPVRMPWPAGGPGIKVYALLGLLLINFITWALFAIDKRRASAGRSRERIAESTLLGWAALGGSPAAWWAVRHLQHKSAKDSFKQPLLLISGVQAGIAIGAAWWWLAG